MINLIQFPTNMSNYGYFMSKSLIHNTYAFWEFLITKTLSIKKTITVVIVFFMVEVRRLSWICSTLTECRFRYFVPINSICSLSGLTSCLPSANPLELGKAPPCSFSSTTFKIKRTITNVIVLFMVEVRRFELLTPCVQSRCSTS